MKEQTALNIPKRIITAECKILILLNFITQSETQPETVLDTMDNELNETNIHFDFVIGYPKDLAY